MRNDKSRRRGVLSLGGDVWGVRMAGRGGQRERIALVHGHGNTNPYQESISLILIKKERGVKWKAERSTSKQKFQIKMYFLFTTCLSPFY